VPLDPLPVDTERLVEGEQLYPQILILKLPTLPILPSLIDPTEDERSHSLDEVLRIRV